MVADILCDMFSLQGLRAMEVWSRNTSLSGRGRRTSIIHGMQVRGAPIISALGLIILDYHIIMHTFLQFVRLSGKSDSTFLLLEEIWLSLARLGDM